MRIRRMNFLRSSRWGLCTIALIVVSACTRDTDSNGGFTLQTGIKVHASDACTDLAPAPPTIAKTPQGYEVKLQDYFDCRTNLQGTFLTNSRDGKTTLILGIRDSGGLFNSACDCGHAVRVEIVDRLEAGERLYVVRDSEVIGDLTIP